MFPPLHSFTRDLWANNQPRLDSAEEEDFYVNKNTFALFLLIFYDSSWGRLHIAIQDRIAESDEKSTEPLATTAVSSMSFLSFFPYLFDIIRSSEKTMSTAGMRFLLSSIFYGRECRCESRECFNMFTPGLDIYCFNMLHMSSERWESLGQCNLLRASSMDCRGSVIWFSLWELQRKPKGFSFESMNSIAAN